MKLKIIRLGLEVYNIARTIIVFMNVTNFVQMFVEELSDKLEKSKHKSLVTLLHSSYLFQ